MEDLYTPIYKDEGPFFLSNFSQITRCVRIHGVHNEEAIDRNTEAIIEQTEMQKSESDESQVQFSGHSMMLERESNESQQLFERELDETQEVLSAHTQAMREEAEATRETLTEQGTAIKDAITAQTSEMSGVVTEQGTNIKNAISAQTSEMGAAISEQGTNIKNAISAQTSEVKNELEGVIDQLEAIANKIQLNTDGDVTNSNNITRAIQNLRLVVTP